MLRHPIVAGGVLLLASFAAPIAEASPVLYLRFDNDGKTDGQTAGTALDSSGNMNHAVGINAPTYSDDIFGSPVPQTGAANALSMQFDRGAAQRMNVPYSPSLDFGDSSFTMEAYLKFDTAPAFASTTRQYVILKKGESNVPDTQSDYGMFFASSNMGFAPAAGELIFQQGNGSAVNFLQSGLTLTDTEDWHYVSIAFDAENDLVRFILDDQMSLVPNTFIAAANTQPLRIGAHFGSTGSLTASFDGLMDEIRISSGFLPTSQLLNAAVPEPASVAIWGLLGLLGCVWALRCSASKK